MKLSKANLSKPGGRTSNEDCVGCRKLTGKLECFVVADGLGGHGGGGAASCLAVETVLDTFTDFPSISQSSLRMYLECAHREIITRQAAKQTENGMRSAILVFCSDGRIAQWAHVGDVRLYVFRAGALIFQTKDHSVPQSLVFAGKITADKIRGHEDRNRLLRALGSPGKLQASVLENPFVMQKGDLFLICSDGFWDHVTELEMLLDWCKSLDLQDWLERLELRLLQAAPAGHDNYSAIALFADEAGD